MSYPAGYIAVRSWDESMGDNANGWLVTGQNYTHAGLPSAMADQPNEAPPGTVYYGRVNSVVAHVERDYGGINSSGGPQVSGRCDHSDLVVVRETDRVSPILFQYCCTGEQLSVVHIVFLDASAKNAVLRLRLLGVNVTGFQFTGEKKSRTKYEASGGNFSTAAYVQSAGNATDLAGAHKRVEKVTLLYTSIEMKYGTDGYRGWDTGTNNVLPVA